MDSRPGQDGAAHRPGLPDGYPDRAAGDAAGLAGRPGELPGIGPVDPWLARDLAAAAARNPTTTWCVTVTDGQGHAVGHGCARPEPKRHRKRAGRRPRRARDRVHPHRRRRDLATEHPGSRAGPAGQLRPDRYRRCDHRYESQGHDPGIKLKHLTQVRYATCTGPGCRRPAASCDFEHNTPYEAGGRTCLCNGGPKCRHDHRIKQDPRWTVDQLPDGTFRWTTPTGRTYTTEPTRYPV